MRGLLVWPAVLSVGFSFGAMQLPASKPVSFTGHDLHEAMIAFEHRTLVEAYEKIGKRDPKWDADATTFLDRMGTRFADALQPIYYRSDADVSLETMTALVESVARDGCDDPMVLYAEAAIQKDAGDIKASETLCRQALPALLASQYSAYRKLGALNTYLKLKSIELDKVQVGALAAQRADLMSQALLEPVADRLERRIRMDYVVDEFDSIPTIDRAKVIVSLDQAPACDPWTHHLMHGRQEIKLAWEARGNGWGDTVSDQGQKDFAAHLAVARSELEVAYSTEASYPEAATAMITVCMGIDAPKEMTRSWFDRAMAAQIDYMPAWENYSYALMPRWGGSHLQMYALGCEAVRSGRFDTATPHFLVDVLQQIARDGDGRSAIDYSFYKHADVWVNLKAMFDGYLQAEPARPDIDAWQTEEAAVAFRCGQYEQVTILLDGLKDKATPEVMKRFDTSLETVQMQSRALASSVGDDLKLAINSEESGDFAEAGKTYGKILKEIQPAHPAWEFTQLKVLLCQISGPLARGEKVTIPLAQESDLVGWQGDKSLWKIGKEGLDLTTPKAVTASLVSLAPMPADTRINLEWYFTSPNPPHAPGFALEFQSIPQSSGEVMRVLAWPNPGYVRVDSKTFILPKSRVNLKTAPDQWHTWSLEHKGSTITLVQDGTPLISGISSVWLGQGAPMLGIYVIMPAKGASFRLRNLSVEPIDSH